MITENFDGENYHVAKDFPETLTDGQAYAIEGYVVPIEAQAYIQSFLLVEDPSSCPFCGSDPSMSPALEVMLKAPIPDLPEFTYVRVEGTLEFVNDPETFQLFRLVGARPMKPTTN
ncbi:MAG: hypothetical protein AAFO58_02705 [Pseudomonadota bacterium]